MTSLLPVLVLATIIFVFGVVILFISANLGPKRKITAAKMMPYECGIPGQETKDTKVSVKFYLTAILFIIFDIEIIFMYPLAVTFTDFIRHGNGLYILGELALFVLMFVVALVWLVKTKALDWK